MSLFLSWWLQELSSKSSWHFQTSIQVNIWRFPESWGYPCSSSISGWWWLEHDFYFSIYWECHHPNWRTHIFQRVSNHQPDFRLGFAIVNHLFWGTPMETPIWQSDPNSPGFFFCHPTEAGEAQSDEASFDGKADWHWDPGMTIVNGNTMVI